MEEQIKNLRNEADVVELKLLKLRQSRAQPTNQQEQVEVCSNCGVKKGFHHLDNCHEYGVF